MVIWMEIFFLPIQQGCLSVLYIIEVIHKEEVGGGFALRFFGNSKVDIFQWLLLEMVIWMEIFFLPIQQGCPSVLYIIEVIHKEEVGGGFYIPNIDFFSILNVGCFFRAEIPAR